MIQDEGLRVAVNSLGPTFVNLTGNLRRDLRIKRLEETVSSLSLFKSMFDKSEFSTSEAALQLFEEIMVLIAKEHSRKKRVRLTNVLVGSWVDEGDVEVVFDRASFFASAVVEFTDLHVAILSQLETCRFAGLGFDELEGAPEVKVIYLNDLCARFGMVHREKTSENETIQTIDRRTPEDAIKMMDYSIKQQGKNFIRYVLAGDTVEGNKN